MPNSLEAALVFSIIIVPGYLLLRGYYVGRAHTVPERDLYVLAQAVVASLIWLAATWLVVEDLVRWIDRDQLSDHEREAYGIAGLVVLAPYVLGRVGGWLVNWARAEPDGEAVGLSRYVQSLRRPMRWIVFELVAVIEHPTAWERAWDGRKQAFVRVVLDDDRTIYGQYASDSRVDVAPKAPQVYLERTYEVNGTGIPVAEAGSVHIDGERIVSVEFIA